MDLRQLKTFCTAARLLSISKAAETLDIGQPTATTHIKALEDEFGLPLFDRIKRPIQLTSAGVSLFHGAVPLVEGMASLVAEMQSAQYGGTVTIATTPDIVSHHLLGVVRDFREAHMDAHVLLRSRTRDEVIDIVESGAADLGVIPGAEARPEMDSTPLFAYGRVLIAPLGHPVLAEDPVGLESIARWPLIMMGPRTYTRSLLESEFHRRGLRYDVAVELDSMDMIKRYVGQGVGISVGAGFAIEEEDKQEIGVTDLTHLLPVEQAVIVTRRGRYLSPLVIQFCEALQRELGESRIS
jgi:DNA-binding transcriptional LysR family regulator